MSKPNPTEVMAEIGRHFGHSLEDLKSDRRFRPLAQARQLAFLAVRRACGLSTTRIGELFNRDHTTIVHGLQVAEKALAADTELRAKFESALNPLLGSATAGAPA